MQEYIVTYFLIFCVLVIACSSSKEGTISQENTEMLTYVNLDSLTVYGEEEVDEKPKVIGGERRLAESMIYPKQAREHGIRGEVIIKFIVLKSGEDVNHTISQSVHPILDKAAIKTIIEASFEPGTIDGRPVHTLYSMPLTYRMKAFN